MSYLRPFESTTLVKRKARRLSSGTRPWNCQRTSGCSSVSLLIGRSTRTSKPLASSAFKCPWKPPPWPRARLRSVTSSMPKFLPARLLYQAASVLEMEKPLRRFAQDRTAFGIAERGPLDHKRRIVVTDRKRMIRAQNHLVGAGQIAQKARRARIEQHGIEIKPAEAVERVGILVRMDGIVALQPAESIGQRAAAMRDDQIGSGIFLQMPGIDESRQRDAGIGQPADGVHHVKGAEPIVAADEHRVDEDRHLLRRSRFPEWIEIGIVERAAHALGLGSDHDAFEALAERLFEHGCRELAALQRHAGERLDRRQTGNRGQHVLVDEAAPVGAFRPRQLVAEHVEPAAGQLAIDLLFREPVLALAEIDQL